MIHHGKGFARTIDAIHRGVLDTGNIRSNYGNWDQINFQEMVSRVTGIIEPKALLVSHQDEVSNGTRMSWTSNRKLTRVEDMAYCLMVGVNMPILYEEGPTLL